MKHKKKRKLCEGRVKFISLCPRGANQMPTLFKEESDDNMELSMIAKDMTEEGVITALVYVPGHVDSDGDYADAEVIKEMAYDSQKNGGVEIDIRHDGKALSKDQAYVAETFIVQKNDKRFEGIQDYNGYNVKTEGAWGVVIKIEDPELKEAYRKGEWNGVSMGGSGRFEEVTLKSTQKQNTVKDEKPMTEEERKQFAKEVAAGVVEGMKASNPNPAPMEKSEKEKADELLAKKEAELKPMGIKKPVFKGKFSDDTALRKYQRDLEIWEAGMSHDLSKAEGIADFRSEIEEIKKSYEDLEEDKTSTQAPAGFSPRTKMTKSEEKTEVGEFDPFSKEEQERAQATADLLNGKKK